MRDKFKQKRQARQRRHRRVRAKVSGTAERPRLSVFRSAKHLYIQLIDDNKGHTLTSSSDIELKKEQKEGKKKVEIAFEVGKLIAKKALEIGIKQVVFDRGGYKYHGRVKAVADGAREGGLKF